MRSEDRSQIAFLRRHKGFSDKGIARHTGLPLIEVQAELLRLEKHLEHDVGAKPGVVSRQTPGSQSDGRADGRAGTRAPAKKHGCGTGRPPALSPEQDAEAASLQQQGLTLREIALKFRVTHVAIFNAIERHNDRITRTFRGASDAQSQPRPKERT